MEIDLDGLLQLMEMINTEQPNSNSYDQRRQKIMAQYHYSDTGMAELLPVRRTEPQLLATVNFTCDYIAIQCAANRKIHNSKCRVK